MKYQLLPDMPEEQYESLKSDIRERGIMIPLEYDEDGNLLDGHHRLRACTELGITDIPTVVRHFESEQAKRYHIRAINTVRRQLTQEQRRQIIAEQLKDAPEKSDRQIASELGVSPTTVGTARKELEADGKLSKLDTSIGADGKEYPRQVPRTPTQELPPTEEPPAENPESVEQAEVETQEGNILPSQDNVIDFVKYREEQRENDYSQYIEIINRYKEFRSKVGGIATYRADDESLNSVIRYLETSSGLSFSDTIRTIDMAMQNLSRIKGYLILERNRRNAKT